MIDPDTKHLDSHYDVVIAGGGILGATLAWESTLRGAKVLLLERNDYGSGASANSLKIIHGGLRYLQSGNLLRARRSASEQALLSRMAPHLVRPLSCVVPTRRNLTRNRITYAIGLGFYHMIIRAGLDAQSGASSGYGLLSLDELAHQVPAALYPDASGGAWWEDAQVHDPVRMVLAFIQSSREMGADCYNYSEVIDCTVSAGALSGVRIRDSISGDEQEIGCRVFIDATGKGVPGVPIEWDSAPGWCKAVNIGLKLKPGSYAFGLDAPRDGGREERFLFMTPWKDTVTAGTWYFPELYDQGESMTLGEDELAECLVDINSVLKSPLEEQDVLFADIGALPTTGCVGSISARLLNKDRVLDGARHGVSGYFRAIGIKYTTARRFAQSIVDRDVSKYLALGHRRDISLPGAEFDSLAALTTSLRSRLPHDLPTSILDDLVQRHGSRTGEIVDIMVQELPSRDFVPSTRTTVAEIAFVCGTEQVKRAADVIVRRTGMGGAGCPPEEAIEFVLEYLSRERKWDEARVAAERDAVMACYSGLPGGSVAR